jgi:hypothetical protein
MLYRTAMLRKQAAMTNSISFVLPYRFYDLSHDVRINDDYGYNVSEETSLLKLTAEGYDDEVCVDKRLVWLLHLDFEISSCFM